MEELTIGERIKAYITERGIKQAFIAEKAEITDSKMSLILNGKQDLGVIDYYKICKALDVPLEQFMRG